MSWTVINCAVQVSECLFPQTLVKESPQHSPRLYLAPPETKNTWARDDPAILVLIAACLCGECIRLILLEETYILFPFSLGSRLVRRVFARAIAGDMAGLDDGGTRLSIDGDCSGYHTMVRSQPHLFGFAILIRC